MSSCEQLGMSYDFPATSRLLTAKQYKRVFTNPVKVSSSNFTLLAVPNGKTYPRLGLVVAKKNVRLAVQRNRCKRIIRDNFRLQAAQLPPMDIVILVRRGSSEQLNKVLFGQLKHIWAKLNRKHASLGKK